MQEVFDNLELISEHVVRTHDVNLILDVLGYVKNIGTNLKMISDGMRLDVDVRTPID